MCILHIKFNIHGGNVNKSTAYIWRGTALVYDPELVLHYHKCEP